MKAFTFVRPTSIEEASKAAAEKGSVIKAGGIDLLDRMKERIDEPDRVVWLGDATSEKIGSIDEGVRGLAGSTHPYLRIGGRATLADITTAARRLLPALAEAAAASASPQIRARATLAGNLCQHTRCGYYRHASFPCFKRGDENCPVLSEGSVQDTAGIFANWACASAHPSSLAPVLSACGAVVVVQRWVKSDVQQVGLDMPDFYASPRRGVSADSVLLPGDVVELVYVDVPETSRTAYEEVRQKAAFDWALVSCCVQLDLDGDKVKRSSVWLGSVAPTPWHAKATDTALGGETLTDDVIRAAAEAAVTGATPLPGNAYKVGLVKVVVRRALERLRAMK